jgi:phospho-acceptor domain-containing protein
MGHRRSRSVPPEGASRLSNIEALGAALLVVDEDGALVEAPGWESAFGSLPPVRVPLAGNDGDQLVGEVAALIEHAKRESELVRRIVPISLEKQRYYTVVAGPYRSDGSGGGAAALVLEITDAFGIGPKEGDAIRQLAHDLRTPLTSMSGALELLESGRLGALASEQTRLLGMVQKGLKMMLDLIEAASARARAAQAGAAGPQGPTAV